MKIELRRLELKNFKGIKDLQMKFAKSNSVFGDNATGKTSIADAFRWLLFDKDTSDRKDFNIKTLDKNNEPLHGLEHSVTGIITIDGREKIFQKIFKEKWQKKRGEAEASFTGHETTYFIDDVPLRQSEYAQEINSILEEKVFKLLTDPLYFGQTLKWTERSNILNSIIDDITKGDIINSTDELDGIARDLIDLPVDKLKSSIQSKKNKINSELKSIPVRIDECNNNIKMFEFDELKKDLSSKESKLKEIDEQLTDLSSENPELNKIRIQISEKRKVLDRSRSAIYDAHSKKIDDFNSRIAELKANRSDTKTLLAEAEINIKNATQNISKYETEAETLREKWYEVKAEEFSIDEDFTCPTCGRMLEESTIENRKKELNENFNADKARRLEEINSEGTEASKNKNSAELKLKKFTEEQIKYTSQIKKLDQEIDDILTEKNNFENDADKNPKEIIALEEEIGTLTQELQNFNKQENKDELKELKVTLKKEIDEIKSQLHYEQTNLEQEKRISELKGRERELSQQAADLEKKEFLCERYIFIEAELLEKKINSKFKLVKFKMFKTLINGAIEPTCEPLINGVPFIDANHGAKINAGIDIINVLSEHFGVSVPLFIDNAESITDFIPAIGQVIKLIVSEKDKKLRFSTEGKALKMELV